MWTAPKRDDWLESRSGTLQHPSLPQRTRRRNARQTRAQVSDRKSVGSLPTHTYLATPAQARESRRTREDPVIPLKVSSCQEKLPNAPNGGFAHSKLTFENPLRAPVEVDVDQAKVRVTTNARGP